MTHLTVNSLYDLDEIRILLPAITSAAWHQAILLAILLVLLDQVLNSDNESGSTGIDLNTTSTSSASHTSNVMRFYSRFLKCWHLSTIYGI